MLKIKDIDVYKSEFNLLTIKYNADHYEGTLRGILNNEFVIDKTIELMELSHLANKGINEISGGEAQRAFIGRALVQQPKTLFRW